MARGRKPDTTTRHGRSSAKRLWYGGLQLVCQLLAIVLFRYRSWGTRFVPRQGAVLLVSNHQSHLDPVLVGLPLRRRMNYLARKTLFDVPGLRWLIESLDAISIDRDGLGLEGLKETLRCLRRGEMVLLFPEGRRTDDGEVARLRPGFCALARRGEISLLPVGIDGAFDAWPRWRMLPCLSTIHVHFGRPMSPAEIAQFDDDQLVEEVQRRIAACHAAARRSRRSAGTR